MSTAATPAPTPVKETGQQKFESFMTKFGDVLKNIANVGVNIAEEAAPSIEALLPPVYAASFAKILSAAASQVAAVDVKYTAIGASTVPYAVKVAEAVAVGGEGVLAIAAQAGFTLNSTNLLSFFSAAGTIAGSLNLANITATPVVPPAA